MGDNSDERKKLLNLFSSALGDADATVGPEVLGPAGSLCAPPPPGATEPSFRGPPASTPPSSNPSLTTALVAAVVVIAVLAAVVATLLLSRSTTPEHKEPPPQLPTAADEDEDGELVELHEVANTADTAQRPPLNAQRGMPQMGAMRPTDLTVAPASQKPRRPPAAESDDPLFQPLTDD